MNNLNVQAIVAKNSSCNVQKKETWIFKILNLMVFINYKCIFMQKDTACHFYSVSNIYIYISFKADCHYFIQCFYVMKFYLMYWHVTFE